MSPGLRCPSCGHTMWSLRWGAPAEHAGVCPLCSTPLRDERRHPGHDRRRTAVEVRPDRRANDRRVITV